MVEGMASDVVFKEERLDADPPVVVFDHGPKCECGTQLVLNREHWLAFGMPRVMKVMIFPMEEEIDGPPITDAIHGPYGLL